MASLSSFREVEARKFLKLGLALAAGLGHTGLAFSATAAAAQELPDDPDAGRVDGPAVLAGPTPIPAEVPASLDELIPPEAVADPDSWAAAGVSNPADVSRETNPPEGDASLGLAPELQAAIDASFADFALEVPEQLAADPALDALAALNAPVLGALPELAETQVGSTLVLALPAAEDAFPERREFIARFRDLSTLRELDEGEESAPQVAARARGCRIARRYPAHLWLL